MTDRKAHLARRLVSRTFADEMLENVRRSGVEPTEELLALAMPIAGTDKVLTDQLAKLWLLAAEATDDEFMGLGERAMPPGSFALLCHCVLHAGTLKQALPRALRFLQVVLGNPRGVLAVEHGLVSISLIDKGNPRTAFAHRMYWILVHGLSCWLVGRRIPLRRVDFSCSIPAGDADYRLFFGAPVQFSQPASRLQFDERFLDLPISRSELALKQFLRAAPGNILVRYRYDTGITAKVRAHLLQTAPEQWPDFDALSHMMRLSTATLRRKLKGEGQDFQGIKDDVRRRFALDLLRFNARSVAEVAEQLGFSEPSAFYRAFRKWTGQTPSEYRSTIAAHPRPTR